MRKEKINILPLKVLCRKILEENIIRVENNEPLTLPLSILNEHCEFRKVWDKFNNAEEIDRQEKLEKRRDYNKNRNKLPEVIKHRREWQNKYRQTKKNKERIKRYQQKPEVKERMRKYLKKYWKKYYLKNKDKILQQQKEYQKEKKEKLKYQKIKKS